MSVPDTADQQEVEWQFDLLDIDVLRSWLASFGGGSGVSVRELPVRKIVDIYLDTEDQRVRVAGFSLRIRKSEGQAEATMKALVPARNGMRSRREITERIKSGRLRSLRAASGPVATRSRLLSGRSSLRPLFEVRTKRIPYILESQGRALGELTIDNSRFFAQQLPVDRLLRVEVELYPATDASDLSTFVRRLQDECSLPPASVSKYETGLAAAKIPVPAVPEVGPTTYSDSSTTGEVAYAVLRVQLLAMLKHEPGTRLGEDPEELHDMRVATRRLRAAMSLFGDALPESMERLRGELGWTAQALGEVRDLDVQLAQLAEWSESGSTDEAPAFAPVREMLVTRRKRARRRMLRVLNSKRYERLVNELVNSLRCSPPIDSDIAARSILETAPDLIERRYRKVRRTGKGIAESSVPEEYHALRIRGKRLRYALEFMRGVYGKSAEDLIRPLMRLQDLLGSHQDAEVAVAHLQQLTTARGSRLPPASLFAMGAVAERYKAQARELRQQFPSRYKKIKGTRWKRLRAEMHAKCPAPHSD